MDNSKKIILDLCGGTGAWSKPYRDAGYDVRLITLPEFDVRTYEPPTNVYGILAAPPCTMFSIARTKAKTPRDFEGAMEIVKACLEIIWKCRLSGSLEFWAMENPRGYLRQFMGKPYWTFEHWFYGDLLSKHTDLWGYFRPPMQTVFVKPERDVDKLWQNPKQPEWIEKKLTRQEVRSITPRGFAEAFFRQNR